jgi:hypothetical protein
LVLYGARVELRPYQSKTGTSHTALVEIRGVVVAHPWGLASFFGPIKTNPIGGHDLQP